MCQWVKVPASGGSDTRVSACIGVLQLIGEASQYEGEAQAIDEGGARRGPIQDIH